MHLVSRDRLFVARCESRRSSDPIALNDTPSNTLVPFLHITLYAVISKVVAPNIRASKYDSTIVFTKWPGYF